MKEYKDPTVEIIELPEEDVITTSTLVRTGTDTETQDVPLFAPYRGGNGANRQ